MSAMLLLIVENKKSEFCVASNNITSMPYFINIHPAVHELKHVDRQEQELYVPSFYAHYAKNA
jgi:hypothetical protein